MTNFRESPRESEISLLYFTVLVVCILLTILTVNLLFSESEYLVILNLGVWVLLMFHFSYYIFSVIVRALLATVVCVVLLPQDLRSSMCMACMLITLCTFTFFVGIHKMPI